MAEPIGSQRDAASALFDLPGYRVIGVNDEPRVGRWVDVEVRGNDVDSHTGCVMTRILADKVALHY